ncbi:MAG: stage III sporulation protein J, partial [Lachnospiraceae bacterium]|nr:stage III sporulation protein J [Lachnospiraceae bacterium]
MPGILLTQDSGKIIGPIAKLLGYIMEAIFSLLDKIGIPNVGLAIILFTIVIYLLLMPLTIKQQKFSKLSAKMNPELQA